MSSELKTYKFFLITGCLLAIGSIFLYFYGNYRLDWTLLKKIPLKPNSETFNQWSNPPAQIFRSYYIFDVLNPEEIEKNSSATPRLVQRGPYVYRETLVKLNATFYTDERIFYSPVFTLYFVPELSNGTENDSITFLNSPALELIYSLISKSTITVPIINTILKLSNTKLFETKTIKEYISGYEVPLLKLAKIIFPHLIKSDVFSILRGKNGTIYQNFTVFTGISNVSDFGRIISWNGKELLNNWYSSSANQINGTDGLNFPPKLKAINRMYSFSPDMCRSYHLDFLKTDKYDTLDVMTYHLDPKIFANSTINPENKGFCMNEECLGNGVLNISSCSGMNLFLSQPHFLNADEKFRDAIDGITPNSSLHDYTFKVEPLTGKPLSGNMRLQFNIYVKKIADIEILKDISSILVPILWLDNSFNINANEIEKIKEIISKKKFIEMLSYYAVYAAMSIILISSIFIAFKKRKYNLSTQAINNSKRLVINEN